MGLFVVALVCVGVFCFLANAIKVNPSTNQFVDEFGRTRLFHGVNAVYKIAPWYPNLTGFDASNSLSAIDAKNLKSWGFNIVRLGVMWPGLEPGKRGDYDMSYLDKIQQIVELLAKEDIYVILDFHQDLFHRKFCGEGVPDYVYESCKASEPSHTPAFPLPAVNETYPIDADGNPTLEACLSKMFATYYLSAEVGAGFQCIYDNRDNMWDALAGYWVQVAKRFHTFDSVLGYELINEPWAGDVYKHPSNLLPKQAEKKYLEPLYNYLHLAIRSVDDNKIIFYEGLTIDYWPNGFSAGPGGPEYNDRQAYAYHIYCPLSDPTAKSEAACDAIDDEFFAMRMKDVKRIGGGMIMTEFGAAEDIKGDLYAMEQMMKLSEKHAQSWMYWQFKYYQDITTCTPQGESLYNADGSVCDHKLRILSRTYPTATAGTLISHSFDPATGHFIMNYTTSWSTAATSLYINRALSYSHGANVEATASGGSVAVYCEPTSNTVTLVHDLPGAEVNVKVTACSLKDEACNCR